MQSYEQLLEKMKATYFEASGSSPNDNLEALARIKAVASELYNLSCRADYSLKQMFYNTASGEFLDRHAELCGLSRKQPAKATGKVVFSVNQPADRDIHIPMGTICSVKGKPYIQFVTVEYGVIFYHGTSTTVRVEALDYGAEHNALPNTVTVMVNPPAGIEAVTNAERMKGGYYRETDDELRKRIKESYRLAHNGINLQYYVDRIKNIEDVLSCNISWSGTSVTVSCKTKSQSLSTAVKTEIENALGAIDMFGGRLVVQLAVPKTVDFDILVTGGKRADVEKAICDYVNRLEVGQGISDINCAKLVRSLCDTSDCEVYPQSLGVRTYEYFVPGEVRVFYYD